MSTFASARKERNGLPTCARLPSVFGRMSRDSVRKRVKVLLVIGEWLETDFDKRNLLLYL